jgi:transposase
MSKRDELTDAEWAVLQPLLPPLQSGQRGRSYLPHRPILNGILWKLRTGARWQDVPERYGPHQTCYDRFRRWQRQGVWERVLTALQARSDAQGKLDWDHAALDSTHVRAHQHAAGARKPMPPETPEQKGARKRPSNTTRPTRPSDAAGAV